MLDRNATLVSVCRPGFEGVLAAEIEAAGARPVQPAAGGWPARGAGWVAWTGADGARPPAPGALVFERQRLPGAWFEAVAPGAALPEDLPGRLLGAVGEALGGAHDAAATRGAVALHVFAADATGGASRARAAAWLEGRLRAGWAERPALPALAEPEGPDSVPDGAPRVLQACLVAEGVWWCLAPRTALADARPGGVHRMTRDPAAPSRSFLKVEEALSSGRAVFGAEPRPRERVIDLGAAPGGWSYAFLKRGCRVLAVDNGPLKLSAPERLPGELTVLRADGLRLRPPPGWLPADWLLSDMLIAPGVCLGLLRKWIGEGWMRRCIVNVKLPQREPLVALRPLQDWLAQVPGLAWRMRQLYHDRREVTVMARLPDRPGRPAPVRPAKPARTNRPQRPQRAEGAAPSTKPAARRRKARGDGRSRAATPRRRR